MCVWLLITALSCITENPFLVVNLIIAVVGTNVVFLLPVASWMALLGGIAHVFSFGLCAPHKCGASAVGEAGAIDKAAEDATDAVDITGECKAAMERAQSVKPSILSMLVAQCVFLLSCVFIASGLVISIMEFKQEIKWRQEWYPRLSE